MQEVIRTVLSFCPSICLAELRKLLTQFVNQNLNLELPRCEES